MPEQEEGGTPDISFSREIRGQIFVWIGIVGGVLIIADHWVNTAYWQIFITLPPWAILVVSKFAHVMYTIWHLITSRLNIELSGSAADLLSITAFYLSLAAGSALLVNQVGIFKKFMIPILIWSGYSVLGLLLLLQINGSFAELLLLLVLNAGLFAIFCVVVTAFFAMEGSVLEKIFDTVLYTFASYLMFDITLTATNNMFHGLISTSISNIIFLSLLWFVPLLIAPQKALIKRLTYLLIGVAIIFGLSEVSKFVERLNTTTSTIEAH
jgi:hypothetical protein